MLAAVDEYKSFSLSPSEASLGGNTLRCTCISLKSHLFSQSDMSRRRELQSVWNPHSRLKPLYCTSFWCSTPRVTIMSTCCTAVKRTIILYILLYYSTTAHNPHFTVCWCEVNNASYTYFILHSFTLLLQAVILQRRNKWVQWCDSLLSCRSAFHRPPARWLNTTTSSLPADTNNSRMM